MLSSLYARKNKEDGFTLIELLIVVIIIGILAAIALPIFIDQSKVAVDASVKSDVRNTVTNITNAQAQQEGTAKAAVSNDDTKIALTALGLNATAGSTATTVTATKTASDLTNVPALGGVYTVDGYNAGGKKYLGTDDAPAWNFSSTTGKFTQGNDAAPTGDGTGTGGTGTGGTGTGTGGSTGDPTAADESDAYYGSSANIGFKDVQVNNDQQSFSFDTSNQYFDASASKAYYPNATPITSDIPILDGVDPSATYAGNENSYYKGYSNYDPTQITSVKLYDKDGNLVDLGLDASTCYMSVAAHAGPYFASGSYTDNPDYATKGAVDISGQCNFTGLATDAQVASFKGGKLVFGTSDGKTSSITLNGDVNFQGIPSDSSNDPYTYSGGAYSDSAEINASGVSTYRDGDSGSISINSKEYSYAKGETLNSDELPALSKIDTSKNGTASAALNVTDVKFFAADGSQINDDFEPVNNYSYIAYSSGNSQHYKSKFSVQLVYTTNGGSGPYDLSAAAGGRVEFTVDGVVNTIHIPTDASIS